MKPDKMNVWQNRRMKRCRNRGNSPEPTNKSLWRRRRRRRRRRKRAAAKGTNYLALKREPGQGCQMAKFDPFLSLDCARVEGGGRNPRKGEGSNFAA